MEFRESGKRRRGGREKSRKRRRSVKMKKGVPGRGRQVECVP